MFNSNSPYTESMSMILCMLVFCCYYLTIAIFSQASCTLFCHVCPYTGLPSVTSLTFNDQSNSLTCISTGGPATTVTWRRDGVVITLNATYQQTQIVTNTTTSTYQTVLTIDPSVGIVGTYNCTVENTRGRSSVTVVVGKT